VRKLVSERIDLDEFRRTSPLPLPPPVRRKEKVVVEVEEDSAA